MTDKSTSLHWYDEMSKWNGRLAFMFLVPGFLALSLAMLTGIGKWGVPANTTLFSIFSTIAITHIAWGMIFALGIRRLQEYYRRLAPLAHDAH